MKQYIIRINPSKIENITETLQVVWRSKAFTGLLVAKSNMTIKEILAIDGVISCREESEGTIYDGSILDKENL
jgi:hypothetical protein